MLTSSTKTNAGDDAIHIRDTLVVTLNCVAFRWEDVSTSLRCIALRDCKIPAIRGPFRLRPPQLHLPMCPSPVNGGGQCGREADSIGRQQRLVSRRVVARVFGRVRRRRSFGAGRMAGWVSENLHVGLSPTRLWSTMSKSWRGDLGVLSLGTAWCQTAFWCFLGNLWSGCRSPQRKRRVDGRRCSGWHVGDWVCLSIRCVDAGTTVAWLLTIDQLLLDGRWQS
ncbi:hypothetical protein QBC33DRAFT_258805 [Phialemonium atrogriseum]|uniref:Uncharacterized protein n=1 Tax=Phialemonium atrogriseum TaxID=1093897 RepID=A0AAJ0FJ09_9PEZI|nr:uncharacterized protein QBC33DRAFT_258805 [Phialemonium atrogriseum]KAK1762645.1 hypothetical protein QBC33DRAFT_258805 [Phialemonium atrogriseum]